MCEEIINDLNSIQYENEEASRFAKVWVAEGRDAAEKSRKLTRMHGQGGSTPQRDRNFRDVSIFITELAINMVKDNYADAFRDSMTVEYLDNLRQKLKKEREAQPLLDQVLNKQYGPRTLLEELFYEAMVSPITGSSVNVMKLSNMIADTRWAITGQVQNLLRMQNANSRKYYKMIKVTHNTINTISLYNTGILIFCVSSYTQDHGGVLTYRQRGRAEFKVVDIDAEKKSKVAEAAELAAKQVKEQNGLPTAPGVDITIPDSLFGSDVSSKKTSSTSSREAVSASGTNMLTPFAVGSPFAATNNTATSSTEASQEDDVNLLDVDFGMAGPMSM